MNRKNKSQVILEFVLVIVTLAILAVASMRLFSNFNLNMINRIDKFKESRVIAVNTPGAAPISPVAFLDYSPYRDITVPGAGTILPPFIPGEYDDARFDEANRLFEESNDLILVTIPYFASRAYASLGGANNSAAYIEANITESVMRSALADCQAMESPRQQAYDDFFEDMSGVDADHDTFVGGIGLLQQVLSNPKIPGLYDPNPENNPAKYGYTAADTAALAALKAKNIENREQLQDIITSIKSTKSAMDNLLVTTTKPYGLIRPEINQSISHLDNATTDDAIDQWQRWQFAINTVRPQCFCGPPPGTSCHECCDGEYCVGCSYDNCYQEYDDPDTKVHEAEIIYASAAAVESGYLASFVGHIQRTSNYSDIWLDATSAKNALKRIIDYAGEISVVPAEMENNLRNKVDELDGFVTSAPSRNDIIRAVTACDDMLVIIKQVEIEDAKIIYTPPAKAPDYTYLKNLITQIKTALSSALINWEDASSRDTYIASARKKIDRLVEIIALR
ncbi:MAG: hypothetical protein WDL87_07940 [Candidatus Omnitrophota bacterium]|jgi:hypothetical protein